MDPSYLRLSQASPAIVKFKIPKITFFSFSLLHLSESLSILSFIHSQIYHIVSGILLIIPLQSCDLKESNYMSLAIFVKFILDTALYRKYK